MHMLCSSHTVSILWYPFTQSVMILYVIYSDVYVMFAVGKTVYSSYIMWIYYIHVYHYGQVQLLCHVRCHCVALLLADPVGLKPERDDDLMSLTSYALHLCSHWNRKWIATVSNGYLVLMQLKITCKCPANYAYIRTHTHAGSHARTHARSHARTHAHTHTHTHTHTHSLNHLDTGDTSKTLDTYEDTLCTSVTIPVFGIIETISMTWL